MDDQKTGRGILNAKFTEGLKDLETTWTQEGSVNKESFPKKERKKKKQNPPARKKQTSAPTFQSPEGDYDAKGQVTAKDKPGRGKQSTYIVVPTQAEHDFRLDIA